VKRSRLAIALAITMAALPVLVLDNFPATAEPAGSLVVGAVVTTADTAIEPSAEATTTMGPASTAGAAIDAAPPTALPEPPSTEAPTTTTAAPAPTTTKAAVSVAAPTTTAAPPTTQAPAPRTYANGDPDDPATWDRMAQCEAGGNWAANTGNGYYGGLQFSLGTWQHYGGQGYPHEASKDSQIAVGKRVQAAEGWGAWPGCARYLGYT
jgi:hypothetical protein